MTHRRTSLSLSGAEPRQPLAPSPAPPARPERRRVLSTLSAGAVALAGASSLRAQIDGDELYPGEKALYEAAQQGRHGRERSIPARPGRTGRRSSRRSRSAIPRVEIDLQRPGLGRDRGGARQGAQSARRSILPITSRRPASMRREKGAGGAVQAGQLREAARGVSWSPRGEWFTIHSLTVAFRSSTRGWSRTCRGRRADLLEARVPQHHRLSRSALDRDRPGGCRSRRTSSNGGRHRTTSSRGWTTWGKLHAAGVAGSWGRRPMRSSSRARSRSGSPTRTTV